MDIYEDMGKIPVGSLVALSGSEDAPIGVVLDEIEITLYPSNRQPTVSYEYRCYMVGKNGKTATMTFSERDLVVLVYGGG
tara:strand:+ start:1132 stop:1371 length:240 start_codon:yes stop_codon:yes gene_type:complete